ANSCSDWAQDLFDIVEFTNYFSTSLKDLESSNPLVWSCVQFIRLFPKAMQPTATRLIMLCFFPSRGMPYFEDGVLRKERLFGSWAWKRASFKNPSMLFRSQREGKVPFAGREPDWMH